MAKNFAELVKAIRLTEQLDNAEQLRQLKTWCETNVSHDLYIEGDDTVTYSAYYNLAKNYFNHFLANIPAIILQVRDVFENKNAIQYAASKGYDCFLALIDADSGAKAFFNTPDSYHNTPLHLAASGGFLQTVNQLIRLGAVGDSCNINNQFPFFTALILPTHYTETMKTNKIAIFRILQAQTPLLLNAVDNSRENIVHAMAKYGYDTLIHELLQTDKKYLFKAQNNQGRCPIHLAVLNNQLAVLNELLCVQGMNELTDSDNRNALHYAAMYGNSDTIESCCKVYQDLNIRDGLNKTPLLLAAEYGNLLAFQELVNKKANPLLVDSDNKTVLHYAVQSKNKDLVEWIINKNLVDVTAVDSFGNSALTILQDYSSVHDFSELEQMLQADGLHSTRSCN